MKLVAYIKHRLAASDFLRYNAVFFVGSFAISALNYLYYPVLGRLLPAAQFGEVQALVSLFLQATIFLGVVSNVAVNVVAGQKDEDEAGRIVLELERLATFITVVTVIIGIIFIAPIQAWLQFTHPLPFVVLGVVLVASVPLALRQAYIRGRNAFGILSVAGVAAAGIKLVASAILVILGFGTAGAIGGLVVAQILAFWYASRQAKRLGLTQHFGKLWRRPDMALIKPQLPYAGLVLVVSLVTTAQFSFDILIIKHYFSAEVAGAYAGIATVARIIFFLTGSVAGVLLSNVNAKNGHPANRALLWRSMGLQSLLGGSALIFFSLFPAFVTQLLIGPRYLDYAHLLPELSLTLFIIAFANLLLTYDLALRRLSSGVVAILGALITIALISASHGSPEAVVRSLLLGSVAMLVIRFGDSAKRKLLRSE